jgi:hypothetical protein
MLMASKNSSFSKRGRGRKRYKFACGWVQKAKKSSMEHHRVTIDSLAVQAIANNWGVKS